MTSYPHLQENSLPALFLDILDTYAGEWFPVAALITHGEAIRGGPLSERNAQRVVQRLRARGVVESRLVDHQHRTEGKLVTYQVVEVRCP